MNSINTNAIVRLGILALGIVTTLVVTRMVLENRTTGAVSALIFIAGVVGALVSLINPRAGLFLVAVEGVYLDYFKKVAVYYGSPTMMTIIQVLVVTLITLGCVYLGIFLRSFFKVITLRTSDILLFVLTACAMAFFFISEPAGGTARIHAAANGGFYFGLVPAIAILFRDLEDVRKYLKLLFWCMVPFTGFAIYQHHFGFTQLDWYYAYTGLSGVSSRHMLMNPDPRAFGLASGPSGFAAAAMIPLLGIYFALTSRMVGRFLYLLGTVIVFFGIVSCEQRTTLLLPFICTLFFILLILRNSRLILTAYAAAFGLLVTGIVASDHLLANLESYTSNLREMVDARPGTWRYNVCNFNTFSDRLRGWSRLKRPESYSALGRLGDSVFGGQEFEDARLTGDEYSHDFVNKMLVQAGVVGVLALLSVGFSFLVYSHRLHLRIVDPKMRTLATLLIAIILPNIGIQMMAGLTMATNPINLVLWSLCGCAFALGRINGDQVAQERAINQSDRDIPSSTGRLTPAYVH